MSYTDFMHYLSTITNIIFFLKGYGSLLQGKEKVHGSPLSGKSKKIKTRQNNFSRFTDRYF